MRSSDLTINWIQQAPHEKQIFKTEVNEIFYLRFTIFLFVAIVSLTLVVFLGTISEMLLSFFGVGLVFLIFFPLFIRPWDVILTNKRLVLRHKFWNIGRFSTIQSLKLSLLESIKVTPRVKVIPLIIGFSLVETIGIPLLNFGINGVLPTPLLIRLFFFYASFLPFVGAVEALSQSTFPAYLQPIAPFSILIAAIALVFGLGLILFGLPRRKEVILKTTGGHQIFLRTGYPETLVELLIGVSRKHQLASKNDDWKWDIQLLDDEYIKSEGRVGLIDRKTQVLGLLALLLFINTFTSFVRIYEISSPTLLIIFIIQIIEMVLIFFAINFAKRFQRIKVTNHRIIFQEERRQVSGLWGERLFVYSDLPLDKLQGFSYSNFTGFSRYSIVVSVLIYLTAIEYISTIGGSYQENLRLYFVITGFIVLYLLFNYRTFGSLKFSSIGGDAITLRYQLPWILAKFSHLIEGKGWLYNRLFPNILSDLEIANLCNAVRNVSLPIKSLHSHIEHKLEIQNFLGTEDKILQKWEKLGPYPHTRLSIFLGLTFGIAAIWVLYLAIPTRNQPMFIVIALFTFLITIFQQFVLVYRQLLVGDSRLFLVEEVLPRNIALIFGKLPQWSIFEVSRDHVLFNRFFMNLGRGTSKMIGSLMTLALGVVIIGRRHLIEEEFSLLLGDATVLLGAWLIVLSIPLVIKYTFQSLPRYSLTIVTRFGQLSLPYMSSMKRFSQVLTFEKDIT